MVAQLKPAERSWMTYSVHDLGSHVAVMYNEHGVGSGEKSDLFGGVFPKESYLAALQNATEVGQGRVVTPQHGLTIIREDESSIPVYQIELMQFASSTNTNATNIQMYNMEDRVALLLSSGSVPDGRVISPFFGGIYSSEGYFNAVEDAKEDGRGILETPVSKLIMSRSDIVGRAGPDHLELYDVIVKNGFHKNYRSALTLDSLQLPSAPKAPLLEVQRV